MKKQQSKQQSNMHSGRQAKTRDNVRYEAPNKVAGNAPDNASGNAHGNESGISHLCWLCLAVNLAAYIGFALVDGPVWCRDSNSYATMDYTREPAYCTFLWLMRKVFGDTILVHGWDLTDRMGGKVAAQEPLYLMAVIVCQAAVMAVTVWYLARICHRLGGRKLALLANGVMWGVEFLNRFGAKRGSAYFQSIMTEGFGIPFYILFLLFLFQYLRSRPEDVGRSETEVTGDISWKKYLLATAGMMTLCTSHHKQLGITLLIFTVCTVGWDLLNLVHRKRASKNGAQEIAQAKETLSQESEKKQSAFTPLVMLRWDVAALAGAGVLIFLIGHLYNLGFHGVWSFHTGSADKIDSTLLYTVTKEDADLFDRYGTEDLKRLFLQIEEQMEEQHLRYVDAIGQDMEVTANAEDALTTADAEDVAANADAEMVEEGKAAGSDKTSGQVSWVELCSHYADSYDIIGFEVLDPLVDAYVREHHPELTPGSMEFAIATDQVCQEIEHVLVHQNLTRLLHLWVNNVRKGFVNTVLRVSTVLNWASLVLWTLYITLLGRLALRVRREKCEIPSAQARRRDRVTATESGRDRASATESGRPGVESDVTLLAGLVLIGTTINSMVVGAIIFPQTRYMIYNMGLFYVCLLAMLQRCSRHRHREN